MFNEEAINNAQQAMLRVTRGLGEQRALGVLAILTSRRQNEQFVENLQH